MSVTLNLQRRTGLLLASALALITVWHAYWAFGGRWGLAAALGGPDKPIPQAWLIWLVTGLLVAAVLVVLGRLGLWGRQLPGLVFSVGCWSLAVALASAAVLNFSADTQWEVFCFGPVATLLALGAVVVARGPKRDA